LAPKIVYQYYFLKLKFREAQWFQEDCIFEKSFACKYSLNLAPTLPPRGPCPEGWYNFVST
jgi:hypothetical protein